jgi:hypothetical protein
LAAVTSPTASKRREYPVRRPLQRAPVHPGALMREILEEHTKMTIAEAARRMKVSRSLCLAERDRGSDCRDNAGVYPPDGRGART